MPATSTLRPRPPSRAPPPGTPQARHIAPRHRSGASRYLVAICLSIAAFAVSWGADSVFGPTASLFFAAVVVSAWYGGLRPGVVTAILCTIGAGVLLVAPVWSVSEPDPSAWLRLAAFLLVAILTGGLTESLHSARVQAEDAAARALGTARDLRLEKLRTETLLGSVSDGVFVLGADGRFVYANAEGARLTGEPGPESVVGRDLEYFLEKLQLRDSRGRPLRAEDLPGPRALAGEAAPETLVQFRTPGSGDSRWAMVRSRPIRDDEGRPAMAVSVMHDLTERIRHERALEAGARELEQLTARLESTVEQLRHEREEALRVGAEAERALQRVVTLQELTASLSESQAPGEVASVVLQRGMAALGADSGILLVFDELGDLALLHAAGLPTERLERWRRANPTDPVLVAAALREPSFTGPHAFDGPEAPALDALRRALGADAPLTVPLRLRGHPLGVLAFDVKRRGPLAAEEESLLVAFGRQCAQALDRANLLEAERRAREEAERASRAKSDFLAMMSHELRTPLNAILGYEELLESEISGPVSQIQRHHLSRIRESTHQLLSLIEQVLSLSQAQSSRVALKLEDVDAVSLARGIASLVEPQVRRKGLELRLEMPRDPVTVRTDPRRLRQILFNVLSNAVKFTEQGVIQLSVVPNGNRLCFSVRDTGRGIDERDRQQIFEPFVQVPSDGTTSAGAGLGLPVALELARHLGGDITVDSRPGRGSTFKVWLPSSLASSGNGPGGGKSGETVRGAAAHRDGDGDQATF